MTVFTIGYEGSNIDHFIAKLNDYKINAVIDVREAPVSRKPGFSKKKLIERLNSNNFSYQHIGELGCPKPIRDNYKRHSHDWKWYYSEYLKHLQHCNAALNELVKLVSQMNCVLLCYEADAHCCHRSIIAEKLKEIINTQVIHLEPAINQIRFSASVNPLFV